MMVFKKLTELMSLHFTIQQEELTTDYVETLRLNRLKASLSAPQLNPEGLKHIELLSLIR